ncbi:MAG: FABP family protein [Actinomycetales bacterium]
MPFEISADTSPELLPVAWLVGRWEGAGVGGYPTTGEFRFGQEAEFVAPPGKTYLAYTSRTWLLDDEGQQLEALAVETGYWRPQPDGALEVVMAHPMGYAEIWVGRAEGAKIELRTDVVARTETAKEYSAGHRLYGLVEGDLMWAYDMAAVGQPLQPHASARLKRVG